MKRLIGFLLILFSLQVVEAGDRLSMLPCPILGGELSNSAATSVDDIDEVMPCMRALELNTVLVPAYWEFIEPKEGHFDFTLIDRTIDVARREHLAKAAREIHDMPLYVNAAMNSRGRRPGEYPSAGPLAHLIDFWHKGAPSIDLLAPDIYDTGFKSWASQYAMPLRPQDSGKVRNRLFIPESRCCENSGVRALYAFGEHQALGFSPFAIDQASEKETASVTKAYGLLHQLYHGKMLNSLLSWGLLFDQNDRERVIDNDGVVMTCRHYFTLPWDPRATDGSTWPEGGAILIRLGKFDYLLAGSGVVIDFKTPSEKQQEEKKLLGEDGFAEAGGGTGLKATKRFSGRRLGILAVDEVEIGSAGTRQYLRRHNGDQTHQGRHARIGVGEWKMLHIQLYEY